MKPLHIAGSQISNSTMASARLFFTSLIACSIFLTTFSSDAAENGRFGVSRIEAQKVTLSVYYETLCQFCATFIVKNLAQIFDNNLITILNLRLVPWGKASTNSSKNSTVCQHGPDECRLNSVEACAINVLHDVNKYFALIYCIEFLAIEGRQKEWQTCFSSLGLPSKPILDCYKSGNGTKIEQKYANETMHLNPPLKFLPWLVLNNQPIGNDYENFAAYVCKAYKVYSGTPKTPTKVEEVELVLYYETLCPYCKDFIVKELIKVFDRDLIDIVNLRLVPYGNAHIQEPDNTIVCQKQHFKLIHCAENQTIEGKQSKEEGWKSSCQKLGMNQKPVQDCYDSGLERKDFQNFVSYVCKAYKGGPKPEVCRSLLPKINSSGNADSNGQASIRVKGSRNN
ncbi:PREDICTED: gamma-interferon-inducible lysosomal [Prunus dulcis]|uniref:PREDICTED: gamma-interferon-inducible lysosomal n=1 Tax=Prunus dulcis TaxID=3755 RepID=A0A5E4EI93_PRUDU|nr:PREDICTED: gamma-interferon-inducible lysosomal [Prunus dulcis]